MHQPIHHIFHDGPTRVAPYSHAVEVGDWLFVTGQMPIRADGTVPDGIEAQTELVFQNLRTVMEQSGFGAGYIVSARVFLTRFEQHYERMNATYVGLFPAHSLPARTCVGVTALAQGCEVEIDLVVHRAPPATPAIA